MGSIANALWSHIKFIENIFIICCNESQQSIYEIKSYSYQNFPFL
jgi:hypothetical protein